MKKYIIGNWKMNQKKEGIEAFFKYVQNHPPSSGTELGICPQALHLPLCLEKAPQFIKIGAQNCAHELSGAYTGEISPEALRDLGIGFTLIGHSERRSLYHEDLKLIEEKVKTALSSGLKVVLCVGENQRERELGKTLLVVANQLECLKAVPYGQNLTIAYEPVWAIGTGLSASPEQAQEVHAYIRSYLFEIFKEKAKEVPILYGGSVKPSNIQELLLQEDINGALVGGASLDPESFCQLYD